MMHEHATAGLHEARRLDLPRIRRVVAERAWAFDDPGAYEAGIEHALQAVQDALEGVSAAGRPDVPAAR